MRRNDETDAKHPRAFVTYAHDSAEHKSRVLELATFLRHVGIDVRLDRWADDGRIDWAVWALKEITEADFVLVIASADYKCRAEGGIADKGGRGAQFEASLLRELLFADRRTWGPKMLPVVLPGRSVDEIPLFLQPYSATRYIVSEFTENGVEKLLAVLRDRPKHRAPALEPAPPPQPTTEPAYPPMSWSKQDRTYDQIVDDLARVVAQQQQGSEEHHSIADPRPMRLTWSVTDTARTAMAGVRWESAGVMAPHTFSGGLSQAGELAGRVPSRRLVVLGQAGAGKTVFAIRLIRDLLAARTPGDPVPLLLPLGAWNPGTQRLPDWMVARLLQDYKGLRRKVKTHVGPAKTLAATLVDTGRIVPVLDGLDEITSELRGEAIAAINRLGPDPPLVITSRVAEYLEAVSTAGRGLTRAAIVELHPLGLAEVRDYLRETGAAERWQPVLGELDGNPDGPLAQTLRVPLMLWLARTVYAAPATAPGTLCSLPDRVAIQDHLLDHWIPAVYPDHPTPAASARYHAGDALAWLAFVARHLRASGTPDLAWWQLHHTVRSVAPTCRYLIGGVIGFGFGQLDSPTYAVVVTILGLLMMSGRFPGLRKVAKLDDPPPQVAALSSRGFRNEFSARTRGALLLVVAAFVLILINPHWGFMTPVVILVLSLSAMALFMWDLKSTTDGITSKTDLDRVSGVATTLRDDRAQALGWSSVAIFLVTMPISVLFGIESALFLSGALAFMFFLGSAYCRFVLTRLALALRGRLPWRTMTFLADAHRRGVLRQAGAVYQFRHARLRDRLADLDQHQP